MAESVSSPFYSSSDRFLAGDGRKIAGRNLHFIALLPPGRNDRIIAIENPVESSFEIPKIFRGSKKIWTSFERSSATIVGINRRINTCPALPPPLSGRSPSGRLKIIEKKDVARGSRGALNVGIRKGWVEGGRGIAGLIEMSASREWNE